VATQDQIDSAYFDLVEADEQDFGPVTVEHFGAYPPEQGLIPLAAYSALSKAGLAEKTDHTDPGKSGYLFPEGVHTYSTFELTELGREWALVGAEEGEPLTGSQILQRIAPPTRKNTGESLEPSEWLEFMSGNTDLTLETQELRDEFASAVAVLAEKFIDAQGTFTTPEHFEEAEMGFDEDEIAYLAYGSLTGAGVGLWEGREDWHEQFEDYVKGASNLVALAADLEGMTVAKAKEDEDDLGPPDQDELAGAGVIIEAQQQGGWAVRLADKDLGWYTTIDAAFGSLVDEMETEGQFPNIYQMNARGNVDWLDLEGNILRSWVPPW
jgi:hypothetical protein